MYSIHFEVEYERVPIRHAYVTCPNCGRKFDARDITTEQISDEVDLIYARYACPVCAAEFQPYTHDEGYLVEEVNFPKCAEGALQKREVWQ